MKVELTPRELTQVLAALRFWQEISRQEENLGEDAYEAYFEEHEPLTIEEIDALCRKIVSGDSAG